MWEAWGAFTSMLRRLPPGSSSKSSSSSSSSSKAPSLPRLGEENALEDGAQAPPPLPVHTVPLRVPVMGLSDGPWSPRTPGLWP